ncbi:hypothetical protein IMPERIA89_310061 [Imperialibacter sp. 89]|nr:hypothetical protein IMPERIA89_310061 [Imperialibacter sp. 89]
MDKLALKHYIVSYHITEHEILPRIIYFIVLLLSTEKPDFQRNRNYCTGK